MIDKPSFAEILGAVLGSIAALIIFKPKDWIDAVDRLIICIVAGVIFGPLFISIIQKHTDIKNMTSDDMDLIGSCAVGFLFWLIVGFLKKRYWTE